MDQHLIVVIAAIGLAGIGAQWVAWRTGWPAIALMLAAGLFLGPVTGIVRPEEDFGHLLEPIVSVAVAIILFEGGLGLRFSELKKTGRAVPRLVLIGVPVAWALGSVACYYVAGLVWPVAILFAGILVVTGPTVILPLIRQTSLAKRPRAILKWEGIVNDPIGALCAVLTYEWLVQSQAGASEAGAAATLLIAALVAGLMGYAAAAAIAYVFPRGWVPEFLKAPVLLMTVLAAFVLSNLLQQETGLLAVTVMGITLANVRLTSARTYMPFKENITILLVSGLFVLLSASLDVEVLRQLEWRFLAFLVVLLFVIRPASVLVSLAFSRIPWKERLFIAWIAPRGIVAVAIAGLFALRLDEIGYRDGTVLVSLSFAVVAATIIAHGFTIQPLAKAFGLTGPGRDGVLIVGANGWSMSLANALRELEVPVVIADTSWQRLAPARILEIPTFHGEILSEATEEELDFHQFQALVATTQNEAYNALVCSEFAPEIGRDSVYQLGDAAGDDPYALPPTLRGRTLFASGHGVEEVARREAEGWHLAVFPIEEDEDFQRLREALPSDGELLFLRRGNGRLRFFTHASRPVGEKGDRVVAYAPPGFSLVGEPLKEANA